MSDSGSQRRDPESFFLPKARTIVSVTVETRAAGSFLLFLKLILKFLGSPPLLIELPLHLLLPLQFAEPLLLLFSFKLSLKEGEENFVGDSEIIALGGASNETKDRPLG